MAYLLGQNELSHRLPPSPKDFLGDTMSVQRTLCIIKPDAVEKRKQGAIIQHLLDEDFKVIAMQQIQLSQTQAEGFYAVHNERPFFGELVEFMTRSPVVVIALEREDAIAHYRKVIGATNPKDAADGTIRKLYGTDIGENAVHGSDSEENGLIETNYYFKGPELL